ncbi:MAG: hypothetical protein MUF34_23470 [Polyangiaceae bacterium]|jgi:hypothetical protein|nr:hypothetical protein [Polyangiaceae bacterium]
MATIQDSIQELANNFVHAVVQALTSASLTELSELAGSGGGRGRAAAAAPSRRGAGRGRAAAASAGGRGRGRAAVPAPRAETRGRGGARARRHRRSSEDVTRLAEDVASFVRTSGGDVAVSDIAKGLDLSTAEVTRPVAIALQEGKIYKTGEKRLTRYFVNEGGEGGKKRGGRSKKA